MRRLRVLVLTKTTALGGAERLVMNCLPHRDRSGFDYRVAALDDGGPLARACSECDVPFEALPGGWSLPRAVGSLRRLLARERIDLVHAHLPVPGALARLAARGLPTRVVYTEHTTQDVYRPASRWINAASYRWQHAVVAVSSRVRDSAELRIGRRALGRIAVVPNGVDPDRVAREARRLPDPPPPRREGAAALLVPASLTRVKGHDLLLRALAVRREAPRCEVWLAGDGPERGALAARAARLRTATRVHLLGRRDDVFALMCRADAVVLPSRAEGLPLALLEALSLGRPVVAAAVGGIPEVVQHGRTGLLVRPEDPAALAEGIDRLLASPDLRDRLGRAGAREARARFDVRDTVSKLESLYRRVAAASRWGRAPQSAASASPT